MGYFHVSFDHTRQSALVSSKSGTEYSVDTTYYQSGTILRITKLLQLQEYNVGEAGIMEPG